MGNYGLSRDLKILRLTKRNKAHMLLLIYVNFFRCTFFISFKTSGPNIGA